MRIVVAILCLVVFLPLGPHAPRPAEATLYVRRAAPLLRLADRVDVVTVRSTTSRWERGRIVTDVVADVDRSLVGSHARSIVFVVPGGRVDGLVMQVVGGPRFSVGERAVVFLRDRAGAPSRLVGLAAGKLAVLERDGRDVVALPGPGGTLVETPLADYARALRGAP